MRKSSSSSAPSSSSPLSESPPLSPPRSVAREKLKRQKFKKFIKSEIQMLDKIEILVKMPLPKFPSNSLHAYLAKNTYSLDEFKSYMDGMKKANVDVNQEISAWSPLHILIHTGRIDALKVFLEKYSPDVKSEILGYNALQHIACTLDINKNAVVAVITILKKKLGVNSENRTCSPIAIASYWGNHSIVRALIKNGANVNQVDEKKWTFNSYSFIAL